MDEDIAIIGMSGRFPGAKNIPEFWNNLEQGKECITLLTENQLRESGVSEETLQKPFYIKAASLLEGIDRFDADFFNISPREAISIDPQFRFFLECAWEVLEDAGYLPNNEPLAAGIFAGAGCITTSYGLEYIKAHPEIQGFSSNYHSWGIDKDYFTTRASYKLNLTGPSMDVQTACSTSMTAIHLACESILRNQCPLAIAGGVNIRIPHAIGYYFSEGDIYSHDGHCRTFDAHSTGTVFGSGIGLVLLKKLSNAIKDRDQIYSIIKGTCLNNDGNAKPSFAAPSVQGQAQCMMRGLAHAKIAADSIQLIEAHGTGTIIGDPIEIQSLSQAFGACQKESCAIGSVKPNIGHLGSASGIASFIKLTLSLFHKKITGHINFEKPNPKIDFPNTPFYINREIKEWTACNTPRRGAINSFGVGGTNVFAILEEAPLIAQNPVLKKMPSFIFTLSAKSKEALEAQVKQLKSFLTKHLESSLSNISYTLNCRRQHFEQRLFFIAESYAECLSILEGENYQQALKQNNPSPRPCPYTDMGKKLIKTDPPKQQWQDFLSLMGKDFLDGYAIDWKNFHQLFLGQTISLPTYPFQGKSYWIDVPSPPINHVPRVHPLLGWKVDISLVSSDLLFENFLNWNELPYLKDHKILDQVIFPATGFLEIFTAAALTVGIEFPLCIFNVEFNAALRITAKVHIQTKIKKIEEGYEVSIHSFTNQRWRTHAVCIIASLEKTTTATAPHFPDIVSAKKKDFYNTLKKRGYHYGIHFQTLSNFWILPDKSVGTLRTQAKLDAYTIYPPLLDGAFQLNLANGKENEMLTIPFSIKEVHVFEPLPQELNACSVKKPNHFDLNIYSSSNRLILSVIGLEKKGINEKIFNSLLDEFQSEQNLLYHEMWQKSHSVASLHNSGSSWILITSAHGTFFQQIRQQLGQECIAMILSNESDISQFSTLLQNSKNIEGVINLLPFENGAFAFKATVALLQAYFTLGASTSLKMLTVTKGLHSTASQIHSLYSLVGLHRSLKLEFSNHPFFHIDVDADLNQTLAVNSIIQELAHCNSEPEVFLSEEGRSVNRIIAHKEAIKRNDILPFSITSYSLTKGDSVDELSWSYQPEAKLQDHEVEVAVQSAALNFRDVLLAQNLYPGESKALGSDFCGVIKNKGSLVKHLEIGQTVFGLAPGAFQKQIITSSQLVAEKPAALSSLVASGVPIVFLTTQQALVRLAQLKKHDKILIHAAAGGIGLAAIQIAQAAEAEVFATVSSLRKKEYLNSLGVKNVYSSRSLDFVNELKEIQFSVILNSLTGNGFIEGNLKLLAPNGCFLELGKRNIWTQEQMAKERPDVHYHIVAIDEFRKNEPAKIQSLLNEIVPLFEKKLLKPLPHTLYPLAQIKSAFNFLLQAKNIGKVVVKFPSSWKENLSQGSYLITGGLGALGILFAEWLVQKGAKQLILIGRKTSNLNAKLDVLRKKGVQIEVLACDITDEAQVRALFDGLKNHPPLKGIIHAAGILHNAGFLDHSWKDFERVLAPKVNGALLLHQEIIKYPVDLDFIVYISSTSALLGGHGRSAYAAANSFLDHLARCQQQLGIPSIALNFGAWSESGMALPHLKQMQSMGNYGLTSNEAFHNLEFALNLQVANLAVTHTDWSRYIPMMAKENPRLSLLNNGLAFVKSDQDLMEQLKKAPLPEAQLTLQKHLSNIIRKVLGQPIDFPINPENLLINQGLDSLNQIEFLSKIEQDLKLSQKLRVHLLQTHPSLATLARYLVEHLLQTSTTPQNELAPTFPKISLEEQEWQPLGQNISYYWQTHLPNDFNIGNSVRFQKKVDLEKLNAAFNAILRQHPVFYMVISPSSPTYKVAPFSNFKLDFTDFSQKNNYEEALIVEYQKLIAKTIESQPKLSGHLYKIGEEAYELQMAFPHSISDGRFLNLFLKELDQAYTLLLEDKKLLPYMPEKDFLIQYPKYDAILVENQLQKSLLVNKHFENHQAFQIAFLPEELDATCAPVMLKYTLEFRRKFLATCQEVGITGSLALSGLTALALSLITNQTDFSLVYSSDGIFSPQFAEVLGPFHKQLPLALDRKNKKTLESYMICLKESQKMWGYLREFPSFLLSRSAKPPVLSRPEIEKKSRLSSLFSLFAPAPKKQPMQEENCVLHLSLTERELINYTHFSSLYRNTLFERFQTSKNMISLYSTLMSDQWMLHLTWPTHERKQQLLSEKIQLVISNFVSKKNMAI